MRVDAAVGELDVDELAGGNRAGGAQRAAVAVAYQRIAEKASAVTNMVALKRSVAGREAGY